MTVSGLPQTHQRARLGFAAGAIVLAVLILFAAVILSLQSKDSVASQNPAGDWQDTIRDPRFDATQWYLPNDALLGFVEIPAGSFIMGSDPANDTMAFANERWSEQRHQGEVDLPTFYIGRYEVTVAQFAAFVQATGRRVDVNALRAPSNHPVTRVTWAEALAYCRWLQAQLMQSADTPSALRERLAAGWTITLPNEAQWEKAARGSDGRIFPWGETPTTDHANFQSRGTHAVGSHACPPCSFGLADMSGNAWELTRSPFRSYPFSATINIKPDGADALWVMRGGSYQDGINTVRAAVRGGADPGVRNGTIGFRLVMSPPNN